jgi:hypothetical protein
MSETGIAKIGTTAAKLMDSIESEGEDVEIGEVMLLVECRYKHDDDEYSGIDFRCTDERVWVQHGMLHFALNAVRQSYESDNDE